MCTVIVWFQQWQDAPLVVAANRDEAKDRPAIGPFHWKDDGFIAPRDEKAMGTWFGVNRHGIFVAVTNRFPTERRADRDSRGTLVVEALRSQSVAALHQRLGALSATRFNAFHLIYGDATSLGLTWNDGQRIEQRTLEPGLHILTERSLGGDDAARTALIRQVVHHSVSPQKPPTVETLRTILATQSATDSSANVCVDIPAWNYGTRSSIAYTRGATPEQSRFWWLESPPNQGPFVERSELLAALHASS